MDITKFDVMILVVSGLAVVAMSFVMPALGLSTISADQSDIPTLEMQADRFEVAGEQPAYPNTATSGVLTFNTTKDSAFSDNQLWLSGSGGGAGDTDLTLIQNATTSNAEVTLTVYNSTGVEDQDKLYIDANNTSGVLIASNYTVAIETTDRHSPPDYLQVSWDISTQATTDSWIGRIPGVGALFDTADLVASVLAWGIESFIWFATSIVFGTVNLIGILIDISIYVLTLLAWLITTYAVVVSSAPAWTAVFVATPGIMLSVTLAKMGVILFRSLPAT